MSDQDRIEKDSIGEVRVTASALWGARTQCAVDDVRIGRLLDPARLARGEVP